MKVPFINSSNIYSIVDNECVLVQKKRATGNRLLLTIPELFRVRQDLAHCQVASCLSRQNRTDSLPTPLPRGSNRVSKLRAVRDKRGERHSGHISGRGVSGAGPPSRHSSLPGREGSRRLVARRVDERNSDGTSRGSSRGDTKVEIVVQISPREKLHS